MIERDVIVMPTGGELPPGRWSYLNTFADGDYVWHAFTDGDWSEGGEGE